MFAWKITVEASMCKNSLSQVKRGEWGRGVGEKLYP